MKRKILAGLIILTLLMIAGGWNIIHLNNNVITELKNIISLHEVEHLRKNLINQIRIVQSDLLLKDSPHARDVNTFVQHVEEMQRSSAVCSTCHYDAKGRELLYDFQAGVASYMKSLSRVYTIRASEDRLRYEKEKSFEIGQSVIGEINNLVLRLDSKIAAKINQAFENISRAKQLLSIFLYSSPFVVFGIAFSFLRNFTSSVSTLIGATRKLKEGNLQHRISEDLKDEFKELADSFNEMAVSINDNYDKMQQTERLAAAGEVAAGLVHEVKNPLAGIKVSIDVLKSELSLNPDDKEIFQRIISEINRIEALLKEFLNYARPSSPQTTLLDLDRLLETTVKNAQYSLKKAPAVGQKSKNITFKTDFDPDLPRLEADPSQLQQVFLNLVLNAIDAINDTGTIFITTGKLPNGDAQVTVSDTGSGMSELTLNKLFTPFFTTKSKGTGLGLSISRRLLEQHGGAINVVNNPDKGVSFLISLPLPGQSAEEVKVQ